MRKAVSDYGDGPEPDYLSTAVVDDFGNVTCASRYLLKASLDYHFATGGKTGESFNLVPCVRTLYGVS